MRIAYADPPYPGMSGHYKDHPDYGGEVDHADLIARITRDYEAWVLHTASTTLAEILPLCPEGDYRIAAWVKPFAAWKKNVYPAYGWEPVIFGGGRKVFGTRQTERDWVAEPITLKRGLTGAKPEAVCHWAFNLVGANPDDELHDLFPGSGAVTRAWETFCSTPRLPFPDPEPTDAMAFGEPAHSPHRTEADEPQETSP